MEAVYFLEPFSTDPPNLPIVSFTNCSRLIGSPLIVSFDPLSNLTLLVGRKGRTPPSFISFPKLVKAYFSISPNHFNSLIILFWDINVDSSFLIGSVISPINSRIAIGISCLPLKLFVDAPSKKSFKRFEFSFLAPAKRFLIWPSISFSGKPLSLKNCLPLHNIARNSFSSDSLLAPRITFKPFTTSLYQEGFMIASYCLV